MSISWELDGAVAVVTMCREPVNAVDEAMKSRIIEVFDELADRDDVGSVLLTSGCRVFSAGADMKHRPDPEAPGALADSHRRMRAALEAITDCPKPVVAVVNGPAIGAGFGLAVHCDVMLIAEDTWVQMPEINVGLAGGAAMLTPLFARSEMRRIFFTGQRVPATRLDALGIADAVQPDALMARASELGATLAAKPRQAMRFAKESANLAERLDPREAYRLEQQYTTRLARSVEGRARISGFAPAKDPADAPATEVGE